MKANYTKYTHLITNTKQLDLNKTFTKFTAAIKSFDRLNIYIKISNDWDCLISLGRVCHNFWPINLIVSMPYKLLLALGKTRLLLLRRLYGSSLVTNTSAI